MSELQKYFVYADCTCGMGKPSTEEEANSVHGKHYRVDDVDIARAADKARIELLERAMEWCLDHGAYSHHRIGIAVHNGCFESVAMEVPAEFADIIKGVKP